jgi:hypothetical protein
MSAVVQSGLVGAVGERVGVPTSIGGWESGMPDSHSFVGSLGKSRV